MGSYVGITVVHRTVLRKLLAVPAQSQQERVSNGQIVWDGIWGLATGTSFSLAMPCIAPNPAAENRVVFEFPRAFALVFYDFLGLVCIHGAGYIFSFSRICYVVIQSASLLQ